MANQMTCRGCTTEIHSSEEDAHFVGEIVDMGAINGFHGDTHAELRAAFKDMMVLYIEGINKRDSAETR